MLFENTWATTFQDAIVNAKGQLLFSERIPKSVIESLKHPSCRPCRTGMFEWHQSYKF